MFAHKNVLRETLWFYVPIFTLNVTIVTVLVKVVRPEPLTIAVDGSDGRPYSGLLARGPSDD